MLALSNIKPNEKRVDFSANVISLTTGRAGDSIAEHEGALIGNQGGGEERMDCVFEGLELRAVQESRNRQVEKTYLGSEAMGETSMAPTLKYGKSTDISDKLNRIPRSEFHEGFIRQYEIQNSN